MVTIIPREMRSRLMLLVPFMFLLGGTGGCKQGPWALWAAYAAHFLDGQGRIVDPQGGDRTTSEGQSYAMFFALVNNDQAHFEQVLNWTQTNLAQGDLGTHLPAWLWGRSKDGKWTTLDPNPASDADLWIAYSLVEAGRLWKKPAYSNLGRQMMGLVARQEVAELPGFGMMLMPGPTSLFSHKGTWTVNPSYLPLFIFHRFSSVQPSGPWDAIAANIPKLLEQSSRHGFAMDWADYVPSDGFYPAPAPGAGQASQDAKADPKDAQKAPQSSEPQSAPPPAGGSYDAIRVYLWAGMLEEGHARTDMIGAVSGMGSYVGSRGAPPEKVNDQGIPLDQDGPVGFSAAVLPYLVVFPNAEKAATQQRIRMSSQLDPTTGLYGKNPAYYDQNLVLFATGFLDERFRFGPRGELKLEWTK